ncbi:hypothetical protein QEJ31_12915 [Pigmentibacter sp. JX0631]|uniref:hypothetical protein n=1 Tax=Pigmentibacter sp. JX0631 TaxID=2976982 RepID=UPI002469BAD8|nr:hypothetical protein [Pigmentibacter sp. JX0631]WGL59425.1 hypothetical protein QEJ31_12915 [Pigmentibacter sp. JX0631]
MLSYRLPKFKNFISIFFSIFILASCQIFPKKITGDAFNITKNVTTKDEIIKNFGEPEQIHYIMGKETFTYVHAGFKHYFFVIKSSEIKILLITFADDKTVLDNTYYTTVPAEKEKILKTYER